MGSVKTFAVCGLVMLAACSQPEVILEGERLTLDGQAVDTTDSAVQARTVSAGSVINNTTWNHAEGSALKRPGNVALAASLSPVWSVSAVEGATRRNAAVAPVVVADGRVFSIGVKADVTALSTSGAVLWNASVASPTDDVKETSGGGITASDGRVYVSTGYGVLVALDAATGGELWRQDTEAAGLSPATVSGGILYMTSRTGTAFAIDPETGKVLWSVVGPASLTNTLVSASPTITSKWALFPSATGEILSTFRKGGRRNWTAVVSGSRAGAAISAINDIVAGPIVSGNTVIVGNTVGRTVGLDLQTGDRLWTANEGVTSHIATVDGTAYFVNDRNELVRLSVGSGDVIWRQSLPRYTRDRADKRDAIHAHFGPVLAGGRLIVSSTDGTLRSFDVTTGDLLSTITLPDAASAAVSVASGTLYVPTKDGSVHAYR
ncbi:MAG: PQQ-binding-like beta-propeller repeat protein [Planktomarina sp.]